jgi:hypothetical protein
MKRFIAALFFSWQARRSRMPRLIPPRAPGTSRSSRTASKKYEEQLQKERGAGPKSR